MIKDREELRNFENQMQHFSLWVKYKDIEERERSGMEYWASGSVEGCFNQLDTLFLGQS